MAHQFAMYAMHFLENGQVIAQKKTLISAIIIFKSAYLQTSLTDNTQSSKGIIYCLPMQISHCIAIKLHAIEILWIICFFVREFYALLLL